MLLTLCRYMDIGQWCGGDVGDAFEWTLVDVTNDILLVSV